VTLLCNDADDAHSHCAVLKEMIEAAGKAREQGAGSRQQEHGPVMSYLSHGAYLCGAWWIGMLKNAAISLITCLALGQVGLAGVPRQGRPGVARAAPVTQAPASQRDPGFDSEAVIVKRVPREPVSGLSVLRNGNLEQVVPGKAGGSPGGDAAAASARFAGAEAWELGYAGDTTVAHSGRHSARCVAGNETEQHGILFVAQLNQKRPVPIRAECWSKARDVTGNPDGGYSLYLDITYTDGTPLWGQVRSFSTGTHDWEKGVVTVAPAKPIREVRVYGLLRGHRGTVWFDDFALWELRPKGKWSVFDGVLVEEVAPVAGRTGAMNRAATGKGRRPFGSAQDEQAPAPRATAPSGEMHVEGGDVGLTVEAKTGRIVNEGRAGGFLLRDVAADSDFRRPLGRATPTPNGARFRGEDADLGLALEAAYEGKPDHVRVRGTVEDLTGRDRAVSVCLTVPLDARGWRWAQNLRGDEKVGQDGDYQVAVEVAGGVGRMAHWPMAAVYPAPVPRGTSTPLPSRATSPDEAGLRCPRRRERPGEGEPPGTRPAKPSTLTPTLSLQGRGTSQGWAIGYPLDLPRINRVGYNAASRELYAAVDFGLSADTARFPRQASFEFVLYRVDPAWGMRSALKRYYEIFPDAFAKRVEREGMWMPFTDISSVPGWQDFGFAFHEGTNNVPFDTANGIYSFEYVEPVSYWMAMPKDMPRTREAAEALLREKARAAPDMSYAAATHTSIIHDAGGTPVELLLNAPWCDGALFIANPAPSVPVSAEYPVNKAQVMFHDIDAAIAGHRWPLLEWQPWDRGFAVEPGAGPKDVTALRCENKPGESSGASQTVILSPPRQEPIIARAWSRAEGVTGGQDVDYSLYLDLLYSDGTPGFAFVAPFRPGTHDWEMAEVRITPPKPVAQVHLHLLLRAPHTGRVWFANPEVTVGTASSPHPLRERPGEGKSAATTTPNPPTLAPTLSLEGPILTRISRRSTSGASAVALWSAAIHRRFAGAAEAAWEQGGAEAPHSKGAGTDTFDGADRPSASDERNDELKRTGDAVENLLANPGFEAGAGPAPAVSGTYIDSMEMGSEFLNYRREHWRDARIPLVFDPASGRCAQALVFGTYEFIAECARRMHDQGRLMFANGALWRYIQFAALLDVMGTETNWLYDGELRPESDDVMMLRRALCYQKPYCLLMNSDYTKFPREYTERYFKRCLFYAIFPGFFSQNAADNPYWATPALYDRDRELFKRYMPMIRELARAGWEPVTHARSDDAQVYVERYGPRDGAVYLTAMNVGDQPKQARVTVDLNGFGMTGAQATEVMSGREVPLGACAGEGAGGELLPYGDGAQAASFTAQLAPEEVWVVRLTLSAGIRPAP